MVNQVVNVVSSGVDDNSPIESKFLSVNDRVDTLEYRIIPPPRYLVLEFFQALPYLF